MTRVAKNRLSCQPLFSASQKFVKDHKWPSGKVKRHESLHLMV